jgi:hypothetical protein
VVCAWLFGAGTSSGTTTSPATQSSVLNPTAPQGNLSGVSCTSATACIAVGDYYNSAGVEVTLAEAWNGKKWEIGEPTPNPNGATGSYLSGVSCASATACSAVGGYYPSAGIDVTLTEAWNGKKWAIEPTANLNGAFSSLSGVSCTSATACTAVGSYFSYSVSGVVTLVEVWNGRTWATETTPDAGYLNGVSCTSATACTAVGLGAEAWNGKTWETETTPGVGYLNGVSCTSATACTAVGSYASRTGTGLTLAEAWNGKTWTVEVPAPQGFSLATANGSVFPAGTAPALAGTHVPSSDPVVGIAASSDGKGYWLVTANGSVFAFGDAHYHGSLPGVGIHVTDIVGMVATANGGGYWLVGKDGGVFAFGDAHYVGSLPGLHVTVDDIVGMIPSPTRDGYVLVGADGGAFVFGTGVHFYGSLPGAGVAVSDIVGIALTPDDEGYWFAGSNGVTYPFGDGENLTVASAVKANLPVVGIAGG